MSLYCVVKVIYAQNDLNSCVGEPLTQPTCSRKKVHAENCAFCLTALCIGNELVNSFAVIRVVRKPYIWSSDLLYGKLIYRFHVD